MNYTFISILVISIMLIHKTKPRVLFFVHFNLQILALVLIFLTTFSKSIVATESDDLAKVVDLTPKNFDGKLAKRPYMVLFYVPR